MIELEKLSRNDRLLVLASIQADEEENSFSGHNTEGADRVNLVLEGRRGLFEYSDDELLEELEGILTTEAVTEIFTFSSISDLSNADLVTWARKLQMIGSVDAQAKSWEAVPTEEQEAWKGA